MAAPAPLSSVLMKAGSVLHLIHSFRGGCEKRDYFRMHRRDPLIWTRGREKHSCGEFSFAVFRNSGGREIRSHVERGTNAIFVGIYDGNDSEDASSFLQENLFNKVIDLAAQQDNLNIRTLYLAIEGMEKSYIEHVRNLMNFDPDLVRSGSSCLTGLIFRSELYIASLGDSRAVLGYKEHGRIRANQLTADFTVKDPVIRQKVKDAHPNDPDVIITLENGTPSIKGQTQLMSSIGNANMKHDDCVGADELPGIVDRPYLDSFPLIGETHWRTTDKFVIFASRGFWDQIGIDEAVRFVYRNGKKGVAKRLIIEAQKVAVRRKQISNPNFSYKDLINSSLEERRDYHDSMAVVVVFIKYRNLGRQRLDTPRFTVQGGGDVLPMQVSSFDRIESLMGDYPPPDNN